MAGYYSKLRKCNKIINFDKDYFKNEFIRKLLSENQFYIYSILKYNFSLGKLFEIINQAEKEELIDYIIRIKDNVN